MIPVVAALVCFLIVISGGGGAFGDGYRVVVAVVGMGLASIAGFAVACVAMKREEQWIAFAMVGFFVNLPFALFVLFIAVRFVSK